MFRLEEIIKGCLQNSQRDQKALYTHYYGYCLKAVFRYIYRYDKAIDVVNDGFVKIFKRLDTFHSLQPDKLEFLFMGWIRTIMVHTAIDKLRQDNFIPEIGLSDEGIWIEDKSRSADQSLLYKELILQLRKLPPAYRTVFNMYVIDGFTHQEIADRLHIAVGTSKSNLSKARGLLQIFIKKVEQEKICYM